MENSILQAFSQDLAQNSPILNEFSRDRTETNTVRIPYILLSVRKYNFLDPESKKNISGITFTLTDGVTIQDDQSSKGISIINFSISDPDIYHSFENIPEPPIPVFADIRIGKKSSLRSIYTFEQILRSGSKQQQEAEGGES